MNEESKLLQQANAGEPGAAEKLLPLVYDELRRLAAGKLAQEKPGQTLDATGLVHEAYLRLIGPCGENGDAGWKHRGHFFAAAAEAMRRILIERARGKASAKRGGDWKRVDFERLDPMTSVTPDQWVMIDEALETLSALDRLGGELVKLRYCAGLSLEQAAAALDISAATAYRHWAYARAWLRSHLSSDD
ncbi:MAG TPA: ECF-type sigma factor [Planctomycetia bacterium]|jgi:RNA polymerase sigma factor (TIGR02999 family)|nr:ECF-type sigma factor [Planctomycetia bacterium]